PGMPLSLPGGEGKGPGVEDTLTSQNFCTKCGAGLQEEEARRHFGEFLCEDCYVEALSPLRTCDPWAVHCARSLKDLPGGLTLTARQQQLYELVKERGEVFYLDAASALGISEDEVRREFAVLRHLAMLRA